MDVELLRKGMLAVKLKREEEGRGGKKGRGGKGGGGGVSAGAEEEEGLLMPGEKGFVVRWRVNRRATVTTTGTSRESVRQSTPGGCVIVRTRCAVPCTTLSGDEVVQLQRAQFRGKCAAYGALDAFDVVWVTQQQ